MKSICIIYNNILYVYCITFICFFITSDAFADEGNFLIPDEADYQFVKECLKDNHPTLNYAESPCIGHITERCRSLALPNLDYLCAEREEKVWIEERDWFYSHQMDDKNLTQIQHHILSEYFEFFLAEQAVSCHYPIVSGKVVTIGEIYIIHECSRNRAAFQAMYFKWGPYYTLYEKY